MPITSTEFTLFGPFEKGGFKGIKRELRFDVNALADFEQETGMGFPQLMQTKAVYAATRALLWAGLKHEDPSLTVDRVGEYMALFIKSGRNVNELMVEAMAAATEQGAFGEPDEEAAGKMRAARAKVIAFAAPGEPDILLPAPAVHSDIRPVLDVSPSKADSGAAG